MKLHTFTRASGNNFTKRVLLRALPYSHILYSLFRAPNNYRRRHRRLNYNGRLVAQTRRTQHREERRAPAAPEARQERGEAEAEHRAEKLGGVEARDPFAYVFSNVYSNFNLIVGKL